MNYKTGFSLTANDYAGAYLNCGYDTAIDGNLVLTDRTTQAPGGAGEPYTYIAQNTVSFEDGYTSNPGDEFQTSLGAAASGTTTAMCALAPPATYVPLPDTSQSNPCQSIQYQAGYIGQLLFQELQDSLTDNFDSIYKARCLGAQSMEVFYATYHPGEYHYTLYYYDQAGNLVKTLPPDGVIPNYSPTYFAAVAVARAANTDMTNGTNIESLATQYRYNTLNQVIAQQTPDAGLSQFWYDRLGRLAVSQNAKQKDSNAYSYTEYDPLGRITEVGQKPQTTVMTQTISQDTTSLASWLADLTSGGAAVQITRTVYDVPYVPMSGSSVPINGMNLRNRVAYTMVIDQVNTNVPEWRAATFYSYDPHGNVDTLVQDYGPNSVMGQDTGNRFKRMTYDYDLISGKVNQVSYQPGKADAFYQQYTYDAENRLVGVSTSRDSVEWENDANYTYYRHGPLARVELGSLGLQGVDYAYTLQGWLKSINPSWITPSGTTDQYDSDGVSTVAYFERDAYKLNLNYFDDGTYTDFSPINPLSGYVQGNALSSGAKRNLYNGNIASQAIDIRALTPGGSRDAGLLLYNYGYDQLNRISSMDAWATNGKFQPGSSALSDYAERYTYDPNGNILTLNRTGDSVHPATAQLSYHYLYAKTGGGTGEYVPGSAPTSGVARLTNQLSSIGVTSSGGAANPNELASQSVFNYQYNEIGQLTGDSKAQISGVVWNVYGKILSLVASGDTISFTYDAGGNRISKRANRITTWYVRDAQGNVMSIYTQGNSAVHGDSLSQTEADVYGSSRLGLLNLSVNCVSLAVPDSGSLVRGNKLFELTNHLGNVLETISDKKIQHTSDNSTVDYYLADVLGATDYYSGGMLMPVRSFIQTGAGNFRYGYNDKEDDNEVKGTGNQIDYGMRAYDPRVDRFLSVDPFTGKYPFYNPYQASGNNPIKFIDLDGGETKDNTVERFWANQPKIDMTKAPSATSYNAASIPRNALWMFKQQLAAKPEMFSEANKLSIKENINPIVDEQWVKYNPATADYLGDKLVSHHEGGGEWGVAIPQQVHRDYFSELHPYVNAGKEIKGVEITGLLGGAMNVIGTVGAFSGIFSGDPDSWVNAFGFGEPHPGDIKKDWLGTGLYIQIMSVTDHYIPVLDPSGRPTIDQNTGQPKYRLGSKTVTANIYSGYIWNEDTKKFEGVNKVGAKTEEWQYDDKGKRLPEKSGSDSQNNTNSPAE